MKTGIEKMLEDLGIKLDGIELVKRLDSSFINCLKQVGHNEEEASPIVTYNAENLEKFLRGQNNLGLSVYFQIPQMAIGAMKFCPESISTREKRDDGLHKVSLNPYVEIASISTLPEFRKRGLSKKFYNLFLDIFERANSQRLSPYLLVGARGLLGDFYKQLYLSGKYSKESEFIPREVFGEKWFFVGVARPDSIGTVSCCTNLGMSVVGSSRSLGGPIFMSKLSELKDRRLF